MKKKGEGIDHVELGNPQPQSVEAQRQNASDDLAGNFHHVVFYPIDNGLFSSNNGKPESNSPVDQSRRIVTSVTLYFSGQSLHL